VNQDDANTAPRMVGVIMISPVIREAPPVRVSARRAASFVWCGLAIVCCLLQARPAAAGPGDSTIKSTFLVIYRPGPAWLPGKPLAEQPLKDHGQYMLSLFTRGAMKLAGPFTDNAGGAVVLEVASDAEAKAIVTQDPAVKTGIFVYELHRWGLVTWEKYVKKSP